MKFPRNLNLNYYNVINPHSFPSHPAELDKGSSLQVGETSPVTVHGIESHCMVWSHEVTCFDLDFQRHALAAT